MLPSGRSSQRSRIPVFNNARKSPQSSFRWWSTAQALWTAESLAGCDRSGLSGCGVLCPIKALPAPAGKWSAGARARGLWHEHSSGGEGRNSRRPLFGVQMPKDQHNSREYYR